MRPTSALTRRRVCRGRWLQPCDRDRGHDSPEPGPRTSVQRRQPTRGPLPPSLVVGSEGLLSPVFLSIEEYLGRNIPAYDAALQDIARGEWSPGRSARPWIEFCITAHYRQAMTLRHRIREVEAIWDRCEQMFVFHDVAISTVCDSGQPLQPSSIIQNGYRSPRRIPTRWGATARPLRVQKRDRSGTA